MVQRFQIEDIVGQDSSGIVFRGMDKETGVPVALRRFFPFGADGEGLQGEEQIAYHISLGRLIGLNHPGMRSVIAGGCDPIDGMPYLATEWIEGKTLKSRCEEHPLKPQDAIKVITLALEVSKLLSSVLAEEGVWVDTRLQSIILGGEGTGRGVTFWISPLKWLRHAGEEQDFASIISLTEELMGWKGQVVGDQAGRGLGGWLKWLRATSHKTNLHEALEMLAASAGIEPPTPTKHLIRQANRAAVPLTKKPKKRSFNGTLVTILLLILIAGGLVGWALYGRVSDEPKALSGLAALAAEVEKERGASANLPTGKSPKELRELSELMNKPAVKEEDGSKESKAVKKATTPPSPDKIFTPTDREITNYSGQQVKVEGVLGTIERSSGKGTIMYLLFAEDLKKSSTRGTIMVAKADDDLNELKLKNLVGKRIRLHGRLDIRTTSAPPRPEVKIESRDDIKVIE